MEGEPGTGKTTLALQFLNEGVRNGESVLYITLAETSVELRSVALSHGWDMAGIQVEELIPDEAILYPDQQYTIFHPSEIELGTTTQRILAAIDQYKPAASCSTRCRNCSCWPKARCATGARCWR